MIPGSFMGSQLVHVWEDTQPTRRSIACLGKAKTHNSQLDHEGCWAWVRTKGLQAQFLGLPEFGADHVLVGYPDLSLLAL